MRVGALITGPVSGCGPRMPMNEAARAMIDGGHGSLVVNEGADMIGILTERDILAAVASGADLAATHVDQWMTANPDTAAPDLGRRRGS